MSKKEEDFHTTPSKKLRFRGDPSFIGLDGRIEDIFEEVCDRKKMKNGDITGDENEDRKKESPSLFDFMKIELTRGYILEHDEERYSARRQKIYSFMKIPREVEKFMGYGVIQCVDSFLYIHTFLPIRFTLALWALISRPLANCLGLRRRTHRLLTPAEICDLLKGAIWIVCSLIMLSVDTNRVYHIIKTQSIIKLYIFYNMLEVGDRLLSAFGQDTIDALFWTATEPRNRKREHFGLVPHILFALIYVILHSFLIMFQATTLNVAVNSNNKGLLTIMMSNNFVELKGSVFKKFDKNNLFQLTCSDVRERFHLSVLLFIVVIQTMKEFNWSLDQFYVMLPDCCYVLITEILIDWIKHAFITRFNELPVDVYREYTISLAYDMTQTRQKHAFSDHSDLVARRMGFIPFPLGVVLIKAIYTAVSFDNAAAWILFFLAYITLMACRILNTICALGKACDLMRQHQEEKCNIITPTSSSSLSSSSSVSASAATTNTSLTGTTSITAGAAATTNGPGMPGIGILPCSPISIKLQRPASTTTTDTATSPVHSFPLQRSQTVDIVPTAEIKITGSNSSKDDLLPPPPDSTLVLGATALFSNSDVDLDDVCLNEKVLNTSTTEEIFEEEHQVTRSVPDLPQEGSNEDGEINHHHHQGTHTRTHKRSESEPSIQSILAEKESPS